MKTRGWVTTRRVPVSTASLMPTTSSPSTARSSQGRSVVWPGEPRWSAPTSTLTSRASIGHEVFQGGLVAQVDARTEPAVPADRREREGRVVAPVAP
ncbi:MULTISPECIES: S-type pyocin domain-containing protein [Serinicoccus]|uniref:S-type pyocin domain-containing protein n=1 Tax=Serinicoccus TaxID=265976 RepID=UPI0039E0DF0D